MLILEELLYLVISNLSKTCAAKRNSIDSLLHNDANTEDAESNVSSE